MRSKCILSGMVALALVFSAGSALAQRTTATLYGIVKDASGAIVPGAQVELTNEQTGNKLVAESNEAGEFTFPFVAVGRHTVQVQARGFKTFVQTGLELSSGQQIRFPLTLEVGGVAEVTTVTAESPIIQSATVALTDRVDRWQLSELPQGRRDFTALLDLQNGVRFDKQGLFTVNGLAPGGMSITVDGVDASGDPETPSVSRFQGFNIINVVSQEAIQEVVVSKGVMSAEVGRTFSGNVNVITKGGTNQFHGSLFETFQNDALNSWYGWTPTQVRETGNKPPVRYNQFGGSVGGPIMKDKLFFFFTYEGVRNRTSSIAVLTVPTPEFKAKAVAAVPAYKEVLDLWPVPTDPYTPGADVGTARYVARDTQDDDHYVARGDYQLNATNSLSGRFTAGGPTRIQPRTPPSNPRQYDDSPRSANVTWVRSATRWTSEVRFGINFSDMHRIDAIYQKNKLPGIEIRRDVTINVDGESLTLAGHTYSIEDVVATTIGRHTLKLGGVYRAATPGRYDEEVPHFRYASLNDFYANKPERARFTFGQPRYYGRTWDMGFFIQDDFRIRPHVVLNLGLRYEYYSIFKEKDGKLYNPGNDANALKVPAVFLPADSIYNPDRNNFLPRVGINWGLGKTSRTILRSGFGMTVAPHNLRNFSTKVYVDPAVPFRFDFTGSDIPTLGLKYPTTNEQMLQIMAQKNVPRSYSVFAEDSPNPYTMQWTLDLQHELTPTLALQTGYVGNKALKVTMARNRNYPDRVTGERPYPQALLYSHDMPTDFSYYHGWQTSLRKRLANRYAFNVNYTWSRAMALSQGDFWPGNNQRVQDENNLRANKGPTDLNRTNNITIDAFYDLPSDQWIGSSTTGRKVLGQILGGWRFGGIVRAYDGRPMTIAQRSNYEFSRPDYAGGDPYQTAPDPGLYTQWYLNPAAFTRIPEGKGGPLRPGNVGKNTLRAPGYWNFDLALSKSFKLHEEWAFQVRAELFNAFNHPNLNAPEVDITRPQFGRITGVSAARIFQMSAKITF